MKVNKNLLIACLVSLPLLFFANRVHGNTCLDCHIQLDDELKAPAEAFKNDVHAKFDLACTLCHGGNAEAEDMDEAKDSTFKGIPKKQDIPKLCGSCHSDGEYMRKYNPGLRVDQLTLYLTSRHGILFKKGDLKAAVCTDCHGAHGILPSSHPKSLTFPWNVPDTCGRCHSDQKYMKAYGIPTNPVEEFKQSVHAKALYEKKDLSAPVCNDCHGTHGAAPPEVASVSFVCRQCHASTGKLFLQSPHKAAFDKMGISECEACHGNHKILPPSDTMLGTGDKAVCIQCHEADSKAYNVAARLKDEISGFQKEIEDSKSLLQTAENKGVEVSNAKMKLMDARTALIQARNLTHGLSLTAINDTLGDGQKIVSGVEAAGKEALKEARFRRLGLVIVTIFIFFLAIALILKIKDIDKKSHS